MGAFVYRLEHERERACASACGPASGRRNPPGAVRDGRSGPHGPHERAAPFYLLALLCSRLRRFLHRSEQTSRVSSTIRPLSSVWISATPA
jgi:hypothetical protein